MNTSFTWIQGILQEADSLTTEFVERQLVHINDTVAQEDTFLGDLPDDLRRLYALYALKRVRAMIAPVGSRTWFKRDASATYSVFITMVHLAFPDTAGQMTAIRRHGYVVIPAKYVEEEASSFSYVDVQGPTTAL